MELFPDTKITKDFIVTIGEYTFSADFNSQTSRDDCLKEINLRFWGKNLFIIFKLLIHITIECMLIGII